MRIGQNPAKLVDHVARPEKITIALVTYIPFLGGYYSESLDVLKACLGSIWDHTDLPYDLLVFDNASCQEVRNYLQEAHRMRHIQYLVLSEKNIGKGGAWNFIFGAAPGEYIAYADSDVYFFPGWLSAQMKMFDQFPNLGMVTGAPLRVPEEYSTSTIAWATNTPGASLARGVLLPWEDYWKHARSLGVESEAEGRKLYDAGKDVALQKDGKQYLIGAAHFQFIAPRYILQSILPIPSNRPMGQVRQLDIAIDKAGYLRLTTPEWWVEHLGNRLEGESSEALAARKRSPLPSRLFSLPIIKRSLLRIYDRIFRMYFEEKQ